MDDKCMKSLGGYIKSSKHVKEIKIGKCNITDHGIEIIAPYILGNCTLVNIHLSENMSITEKSFPLILNMVESSHIEYFSLDFTAIKNLKKIILATAHNMIRYGSKDIILEQRYLYDEDVTMICKHIKEYGTKTLRQLRGAGEMFSTLKECNVDVEIIALSNCKMIDNLSLPEMVAYIQSSKVIDVLINHTSIEKADVLIPYLFVNMLKNGIPIVDLKFRKISNETLVKMCDAIHIYGCGKLEKLDLYSNKITTKEAALLFKILRENNSIINNLNISENMLSDECMGELGKFIAQSEYLNKLDMSYLEITDKGIEILSEYLIGNIVLKELDLSGNAMIAELSGLHLLEIAKKSGIIVIHLTNTAISYEKVNEIENELLTPIDKRELPVKSSSKSAAKGTFTTV